MIEVFNKKKKRIGFIENGKIFDKKHNLIGYLEENEVKDKSGRSILKFDKHDNIFIGNEHIGFIYNSKIFFREQPVFEILEENREIYSSDGMKVLSLIGNHEKVDIIDFLAIATLFLKSNWMKVMYSYCI